MREGRYLLRYQIQFFAKDGPGGEKTEEATPKKLEDARKEGQVSKSKDLGNFVMLFALFLILKLFLSYMGKGLLDSFSIIYGRIGDMAAEHGQNFTIGYIGHMLRLMMGKILLIILPTLAIGVLVAFIMDLVQVKWKVTTKPLKPKFSKLNPISGFKRIFSVKTVVELLKSIAIITVITVLTYMELKGKVSYLFILYQMDVFDALGLIGTIIINLGMKISAVLLIIGFADLIYQKRKFKEDMKMTKQEVKDEYKNAEGDPQIKGQIRKKMQQASMRRMMQSVPKADVVITNPTHFAVAIQYDSKTASAPVVVAKGEDFLAQRIKETAKEYDVEIVENKPLARALYYNVDIGGMVPPELYQAVAEVLAFVYKVKNKVYNPE